MNKIIAVYKILNTVTGDFYIGSSKDIMKRWANHKCPSTWKNFPNNKMYQDMQEYGIDKFRFQILAPVMPEYLTQVEQELIEMLKPIYNDRNSKGQNVERIKATNRKAVKKYRQSEKGKQAHKKGCKKHFNKLCEYNGETLKLGTLRMRFQRFGIPHPYIEAKKYLINVTN